MTKHILSREPRVLSLSAWYTCAFMSPGPDAPSTAVGLWTLQCCVHVCILDTIVAWLVLLIDGPSKECMSILAQSQHVCSSLEAHLIVHVKQVSQRAHQTSGPSCHVRFVLLSFLQADVLFAQRSDCHLMRY